MKISIIVTLFLLSFWLSCTPKIVGTYCGGEGGDYRYISFSKDSSFEYFSGAKFYNSKGIGHYTIRGNALLLEFVKYPIEEINKDSLIYLPSRNDSIIISIQSDFFTKNIDTKQYLPKHIGHIFYGIEGSDSLSIIKMYTRKPTTIYSGNFTNPFQMEIFGIQNRKTFCRFTKPGHYLIKYRYNYSGLNKFYYEEVNSCLKVYEIVNVNKKKLLLYKDFLKDKSIIITKTEKRRIRFPDFQRECCSPLNRQFDQKILTALKNY